MYAPVLVLTLVAVWEIQLEVGPLGIHAPSMELESTTKVDPVAGPLTIV
jgi:hypothetical protein